MGSLSELLLRDAVSLQPRPDVLAGFGSISIPPLPRLRQLCIEPIQMIRADVLYLERAEFRVDAFQQRPVDTGRLCLQAVSHLQIHDIGAVHLKCGLFRGYVAQLAVFLEQRCLTGKFFLDLAFSHSRLRFPCQYVVLEPLTGSIPASEDPDLVGYDIAVLVLAGRNICHGAFLSFCHEFTPAPQAAEPGNVVSGGSLSVPRHSRSSEQQLYRAVIVDQHLVAGPHGRQLVAGYKLAQKALADSVAVLVQPFVDLVDGTDGAKHDVSPFHISRIYI